MASSTLKSELITEIEKRREDKIIEPTNVALLIKLINNADNDNEAMAIAELGTMHKTTGFYFNACLEKIKLKTTDLKRNDKLSFVSNSDALTHKLIIGDNYDALQNLLTSYSGKIDVIYIDPPYGCDSTGEFARTSYNNNITRDDLLSMLYPRLVLARQLLSDDGVIYCSISDRNQAYVKCLFDEVFGEKSFITNIHWKRNRLQNDDTKQIEIVGEHILFYVKNKVDRRFNKINGQVPSNWLDNCGVYEDSAEDLKNIGVTFSSSKPTKLIRTLIQIASNRDSIILDFFAGSGTTGQAVMELNREDGGRRTFILCTNNEITASAFNGIAFDVTAKRLKRIMSGTCYNGSSDFDWVKDNVPYGDNLEVYDVG